MVRTRSWSISANPVSPCFINSSTANRTSFFRIGALLLMQRCCVFCRRPWTPLDWQFFSPHLPSRAKNARASARILSVYMGMWTVDGLLVAGCYLSMHRSVYLSVCLRAFLSIHLCTIMYSIHLSFHLSIHPSVRLYVCLSVCLYACLSICPSIHLSIYLHIGLQIQTFVDSWCVCMPQRKQETNRHTHTQKLCC